MSLLRINATENDKGNFGEGSITAAIVRLAIPQMLAQAVQVLYNIVDRMYIGHMDAVGAEALTGVGLVFPIIAIVTAFTALFGTGGAPVFSIMRGRGDDETAKRVIGNACTMLMLLSVVIVSICLLFGEPILYALGASERSVIYAGEYLQVYILGTFFQMFSAGMNPYITNQGYGAIGMWTTVIGALINIFLDPLFIYEGFTVLGISMNGLNMGVTGAALATVLSQFISAVWAFIFIVFKARLRLSLQYMRIRWDVVLKIIRLGVTGFVMSMTNCFASIAYNTSLQRYGGDVYVAAMTINNSVKEFVFLSMHGFTSGAQPVLSYNYGAGKTDRITSGIRFMTITVVSYTLLATILVLLIPEPIIRIFNTDPEVIEVGSRSLRIFFSLGAFMSLQSCGQQTYVSLGMGKYALFFSIFRKIILVVPLIYIMPLIFPSIPAEAVLMSEPVADIIGGCGCFITMMVAVYRPLRRGEPVGIKGRHKKQV